MASEDDIDLDSGRTVEMDSGEFGELKGTVRAILEGMAGDRKSSKDKDETVEDRRRWLLRIGIPTLVLALGGGGWKADSFLDDADAAEEAEVERIDKIEGQVKNLAGAMHDTRKANSEGLMKISEKLDAISPAATAIEMPDSVKDMAEEVAEVERKREIDALMNGETE